MSIQELLNQLKFIGFEIPLLGLFLTASLIVIARDWRFLIFALLAQYVLVGFLLAWLVRPDIAVLSVLVGAFVCPILYLSARQIAVNPLSVSALDPVKDGRGWWQKLSWHSILGDRDFSRRPSSTGTGFRIFVTLLIILVAVTVSESFPLPDLPHTVSMAVYWLILAGLVILILTEDPMKAGHGLFTAFSGFGLLYTTLESSLLLTGLWGTVSLLIALAVGYLTVVKGTGTEEEI